MIARLRALAMRVTAAVALVALLAGPMILVGRLVGRPWPTGDQLRQAWRGGDLDWQVAAKLAALGFWLLWTYLTAVAFTEVVHVLRRRGPAVNSLPRVEVLGLPRGVRWLVRIALTSAVGVGTIVPISVSAAARSTALPPPTLVIATAAPPVTAASVPDEPIDSVTATARDTPYSIAVRCCNDPEQRARVLDLNRGRELPDGTHYDGGPFPAGWNVLVPAAAPPTEPLTSADEYPVPIPAGDHIVERGENLWVIATHHLQDAGLHAPSERQVADYWHDTIDENTAHLTSHNPNLIYAGEHLNLPTAGPAPAPPLDDKPAPAPAPPNSLSDPAPAPPTAPDTLPPPPPASVTTQPPVTPAPVVTRPPAPPASITPSTTTAAPTDATNDHRDVIWWTGGSVLAAGAVLALTRTRRRRLASGTRRPPAIPTDAQRDLELALRQDSDLDHIAWATTVLADLGTRHRAPIGHAAPSCMQLTSDAIDILWTTPADEPPAPWRSGDGGWSWHRDHHPDDPTISNRTQPCPTLATIGTRPDQPDAGILLHLEAAGTLHMPDEPVMRDLVRAVIHELAHTPFADDIDLLVTDPHLTPGGPGERVRRADLADAVKWAQARTADTIDNLARRRLDTTFAARLTNTSIDGFQPIVITATATSDNRDDIDALIDTCRPGTGATAIIIGGRPQGWTLTPRDEGAVHIEPLGFDVIPVALRETDASNLDELLTTANATDDATESPVGLADEPATLALDDAITQSEDESFTEATFDVEIQVLGQVNVTGAREHLTPGELELLAYLAFHPTGDTADTIMTQLWPTRPSAPKTFRNRCTNLRTKLGVGSDGELLFPEARDTGLYHVSPLVTTDLDRFRARIAAAERTSSGEAITLLKEALALVHGPAFRAAGGYDWAYADQIEDRANHDIQHAARRLAELALEAEDPPTALYAAAQAKLALGVLAAEPLGRLEMLAHAHDSNTAAITNVYRELQAALEHDDPAADLAAETTALYRQLVPASRATSTTRANSDNADEHPPS